MRELFSGTVGRSNRPVCRLLLVPCLLASFCLVPAQDADFIGLLKTQNFFQGRPHIVSLSEDEYSHPQDAPFTFEADVQGVGPGSLIGATLALPSSPGGSVTLRDFEDPPQQREFGVASGYDTFAELNRAFPDGAYTFHVTGASDSPPVRVVPLDLMADASGSYRGVTKFTAPVFQGAQSINPALPFTFQWDAIPGGLATDFVWLSILDDFGSDFYYSPDLGEPGALDGKSTSFTIPAGILGSGARYEVYLGVFHLVDQDRSYTAAVSAYGKTTSMEIQTTGAVDNEAPAFVRSVPRTTGTGIGSNTIVTFVFGEPMDPSVDPAQAITWTGVPTPALFSYRWSPDGTRLFCHYPPGLPTATTITWVINPIGSAAKVRDAAGNIMDGSRMGNFQTSPTGNSGVSDVTSLVLYRGKSFRQTSGGIVDLERHLAGFDLELGGLSTVSSVDLTIPGGGNETGLGEFAQDYRSINGESSFAEPDDTTRIFPAGDYTVSLHTFHDGVKSVTLNLGSGSYPAAPTVRNYPATQSIDGSQDFVLQWDPWTGGTSSDYILVRVDGDAGMTFFKSPNIGEPLVLDGRATRVTIPADSLPPGRSLSAQIKFAKITAGDTVQYSGVPVGAALASVTSLNLRTIGDPLKPQLEILSRTATQVRLRLTAERGRYFQIQSGATLPPANQVWFGRVLGNPSGFRASFDYTDNTVSGVPVRFYQAHESQASP